VISYLAALLAALTNATSDALNHTAAREASNLAQFGPRLITDLLRRRAWLAAHRADGPVFRVLRGGPVKAASQR
jgi:hypothetical protein